MKNKFTQSKFNLDVLWNLFAFGGVVVVGILLNILIIIFYDEEALGVFNLAYATYILLSQLAVGGVHLSIQYFIPKFSNSKEKIATFLISALFSSLITGIIVIGLSYLFIPTIGKILNSENVKEALYFTLWGLVFFSFNKIILSVHNGLRNMKHFALFQFLRFFFMFFILLLIIFYKTPMQYISCLLPISEFLLFCILIFSIRKYLNFKINKRFKQIFFIQFKYGNKALIGNFLLDINTKVDVFTLGIFLNDYWVGIYSFAATIAEGFMQLPVIFRNNINPIITRAYSKPSILVLQKVLVKNKIIFYKIIGALGVVSIIFFPLIPYLLDIDEVLVVSVVYAILCGGFILSGGYQPFLMIFNQLGSPKLQTKYIFIIFLANVIGNLILVPFIGVYGAALGTTFSFIIQVISLKYFMFTNFRIKI